MGISKGQYVQIIFEDGIYVFTRKVRGTDEQQIFFSTDKSLRWKKISEAVGYVTKTSKKSVWITNSKAMTENQIEVPREYIAYHMLVL